MLPLGKFVFVLLHVDAASAELHSLGFQAKSLLEGVIAAQLDRASRAQHALPGQSDRSAQGRHHPAGSAGESGSLRDGTVAGNLATRDTPDGCDDAGAHVALLRHAYSLS